MKRALITGINGFTGRYVAQELEQAGWEVWGIGSQAQSDCSQRYRQVNLLDHSRLNDVVSDISPDVVVHLAAIAFVAHGDADAFYRVNIVGTRNLLSALANCDKTPDCVLIASSAYIYGNATAGVLNEKSAPNPANDYAVSKLAMEYMSNLWRDKLPIVIARPFNYTGVGQSESFLLPKIVNHFRRGESFIELGNLDVSRDFTDVRAVAKAYRRLLQTKPINEIVNICSGKAISLRHVLDLVQRISGRTIEVRLNPNFVRANDVKTLSGDPSKLLSIIGDWDSPCLTDTLKWMMEA
ncbi:NAD-dependent epimerase/dehydratase family protein [Orrella daihaiensis]|uniref:NAD-dependent epimerase/dehydratase family protein n=1 Tax=Orrella daihaiensis TaxID=2782176 RepID=A0ABY4AHS2_9BURK|nr:NAD-dependent epimerase/dehydratase family protein [Orrella daihaiensis]UOD49734.1 NAD-dependent epimerase/dehydratase family protein [Orrella daihaiensis]